MPLRTIHTFVDFGWFWEDLVDGEGNMVGKKLVIHDGSDQGWQLPFALEAVQKLGQQALGIGKVEVPVGAELSDAVRQLRRRGGQG